MSVVPGTRLGPYEILSPLGAGGMGEVWRARDTKLDREVALKFLPASFAENPERLARFEREARVLASLNHPSIAGIYGLHEHEGLRFLAMELAPGADLAERLKRGKLPVEEALDVARQIAEAVEAAHEQGIVHRDLKPANIQLTPEGRVKVLDFGLAKALESAAMSGPSRDAVMSPTITSMGTVAGVILGTAAYMSPEQARGKSVDKRADIWAFGCVLYEMLSGKLAFAGETISDTMAAVLTRDPDWSALPPGVPPRVRELMERCLRKDAKDRLRDIGDARIELAGARGAVSGSPAAGLEKVARPRRALALLLSAAAVVAALAGGTIVGRRTARTEPPAFRPLTFERGFVHSARFGPDGQTVIYGAAFEGQPVTLMSTRTDGFESRRLDLPSADIAGISRNGQMALLLGRHHIGSWLRIGTLAQVALSGGEPREIQNDVFDADISPDGKQFAVVVEEGDDQVLQYPIGKEIFRTRGWISQPRIAPDGKRIAFVHHRVRGDDLGEPTLADDSGKATLLGGEQQYQQGLAWSPAGDTVWFTETDDAAGGTLWKVSPGGAPRMVLRVPSNIRVQDVAADGSILLDVDESRAVIAGQLAGDTAERTYSWWDNDTPAAISNDGTIYAGDNSSIVVNGEYAVFFRRGGAPPVQMGMGLAAGLTPDGKFVFTSMLTADRSKLTMRPVGPGQPRTFDLGGVLPDFSLGNRATCSEDGRRIAFLGDRKGTGRVAWVLDLAGGAPRPVSPDGAAAVILSPDGSSVAVGDPKRGLYVVPAAGGQPKPIQGAEKNEIPLAWSSDGRSVFAWNQTLPPKIYRIALDGGRRELARELMPPDPAGILYGWLTLTTDGRFYMHRYRRALSSVCVVKPS